jgi:hypothetical protein
MDEHRPRQSGQPDRHDDDDADRRGEHKYPPDPEGEAARPSQRDRDELKSRLIRRS